MQQISLIKYLQKTKGISRRDFEDMIKEEAIYINDQKVDNFNKELRLKDNLKVVLPDNEIYEETINKIPTFQTKIVAFNKPKGYVVSKDDQYNNTIFELLPQSRQKDFYYIGRLDKQSHGLLLLTNDPEIVNYYENPKNNIFKIYEVKIDRNLNSNHIKKTKKGIYVDENLKILDKPSQNSEFLQFYDIHKVKKGKEGEILRIVLKEGRNQHIRKVLQALGYKIKDLFRIKVGKYELGKIKPGKYMIHSIKRKK